MIDIERYEIDLSCLALFNVNLSLNPFLTTYLKLYHLPHSFSLTLFPPFHLSLLPCYVFSLIMLSIVCLFNQNVSSTWARIFVFVCCCVHRWLEWCLILDKCSKFFHWMEEWMNIWIVFRPLKDQWNCRSYYENPQ